MFRKIAKMHYKVLFLYGSLYLYVMGMLLVSGFALYTDNTLTLYMALFGSVKIFL